MRSFVKLFVVTAFVVTLFSTIGCDQNDDPIIGTTTPVSSDLKAIISINGHLVTTGTYTVYTRRLNSFWAGASTGSIIWAQLSFWENNSLVDSVGGQYPAQLYGNENWATPRTIVYRIKLWSAIDTAMSQVTLDVRDSTGGSSNLTSQIMLQSAPLQLNGTRKLSILVPKDRTANGPNNDPRFVSDLLNWQYTSMQNYSGTYFVDTMSAFDCRMTAQYTGNYNSGNMWSITAGENHRLPNDTLKYGLAVIGGVLYTFAAAPSPVLRGDTGDQESWGSIRWKIVQIGGQYYARVYFHNATIPNIEKMVTSRPQYQYKVANGSWNSYSNQIIDMSDGWGVSTDILLGSSSGSYEVRLRFQCEGVLPQYRTSSIAWYPSDNCFLLTLHIP